MRNTLTASLPRLATKGESMTYPSQTQEAFRLAKRKQRERERERLAAVNEKLAAQGIDWKELMKLIVSDRVEIVIKEK